MTTMMREAIEVDFVEEADSVETEDGDVDVGNITGMTGCTFSVIIFTLDVC